MPKDGGPAFPKPIQPNPGDFYIGNPGMSLRDYFAAKAMQGKMAHGPIVTEKDPSIEGVCAHCYRIADAMIAEREKNAEEKPS